MRDKGIFLDLTPTFYDGLWSKSRDERAVRAVAFRIAGGGSTAQNHPLPRPLSSSGCICQDEDGEGNERDCVGGKAEQKVPD